MLLGYKGQLVLPVSTLLLLSFFFFIYFWLCWVFVSVRGLSPVAVSGGHSSSRCAGLLLSRPLLLRSTGSRRAGSVVVAHGLSCSVACGIFPDQSSNPCPLHWQADSFFFFDRQILNHCATRETLLLLSYVTIGRNGQLPRAPHGSTPSGWNFIPHHIRRLISFYSRALHFDFKV